MTEFIIMEDFPKSEVERALGSSVATSKTALSVMNQFPVATDVRGHCRFAHGHGLQRFEKCDEFGQPDGIARKKEYPLRNKSREPVREDFGPA